MLDKNIPVEQIFHSGFGENGRYVTIFSSDLDMDFIRSYIYPFYNIINKIEDPYGGGVGLTNDKKKDALKFLDEQCLPQYGTKQQLRPGAKPNIFGRYRETDYETVSVLNRNEIKILDCSSDLIFLNDGDDFRTNPSNAPYRIAAIELLDGRLIVAKVTFVNRYYAARETRVGNSLFHAYLFPKGTKLEDVDWKNLDFKMTLTKDEYADGSNPFYLQPVKQIKYGDALKKENVSTKQNSNQNTAPQKQPSSAATANQNDYKDESTKLCQLFMDSLYSKGEEKQKAEKEFNLMVSQGADIYELENRLLKDQIQCLTNNLTITDDDLQFLEDYQNKIYAMNTAYNDILDITKKYRDLQNKSQKNFTDPNWDNWQTQLSELEETIHYGLNRFSAQELEKIKKLASSHRKVLINNAVLNKLKKGEKVLDTNSYSHLSVEDLKTYQSTINLENFIKVNILRRNKASESQK